MKKFPYENLKKNDKLILKSGDHVSVIDGKKIIIDDVINYMVYIKFGNEIKIDLISIKEISRILPYWSERNLKIKNLRNKKL